MKLPDFLIIGAMKAGTTGMFRDLGQSGDVFLPRVKEPEALLEESVTTSEGRRAYSRLFTDAEPNQVCGEASTSYSKLPDYQNVVERAAIVIPEARIIYMVRDPVARIVSHYRHDVARGFIDCSLEDALEVHPRLLDYTRYATQFRPWLDAFGPNQTLVVKFEDYAERRTETVQQVLRFLGAAALTRRLEEDAVYNVTNTAAPLTGRLRKATRSGAYRRFVQPLLPERLRRRLTPLLSGARPNPTPDVSKATISLINTELSGELSTLRRLTDEPSLMWE